MTRLGFLFFFIVLTLHLRAQCNFPEFSVPQQDKLCRNSPIRFVNETEASNYYWDFCPENFVGSPVNQVHTISGSALGYGYKIIQESGQWHGFLISRSLDKMFRLDFGADPLSTPTVHDLGNPGNLMDAPEGIDFYKEGSEWFAFVGKGENSSGQVVKFHFGSDLSSTPSATGYGTFGLGSIRIRDLSIRKQGTDIILVLLLYNTSSLNRVNFGNSLHNAPAANNVVTIPGASLPRGLDLVTTCDPVRAHIVNENGLVQQISFGSNLLGPITAEGGFTFTSVVQPWKIKTVFSGGNYYAFISNNNRKYSIINFKDLSLSAAPEEVLNNNDVRFIGFDIIRYEGKTLLQGGGPSNVLFNASYQTSCNLAQEYSHERNPVPIQFDQAGDFQIDLSVDNTGQESLAASETLRIKDLNSPEIVISSEGMCAGNDVIFSATNAPLISSWLWHLGNGLTSVSASPVTSYSESGSYNVVLIAEATNTCLAGGDLPVKIYPEPIPEFVIPAGLICTNNVFTFSSLTTDVYNGNLSYQWFIDDSPKGIERDLQYTFTTLGAKSIRLSTSIPGCSNEVVKATSDVQSGPFVDFSFTGTCEDEAFSFQSEFPEPVESFTWDFGNGQNSIHVAPEIQFADALDYTVKLSATNATGCETIKSKTVSVHSKPLIHFDVQGPPNTCSGQQTAFENQTVNPDAREITRWLWEFSDTNSPNATSEKNAVHTFVEPGTYSVSLTATTEGGCVSSGIKEVVIFPSPSAHFTHTPPCEDVPVSFSNTSANSLSYAYWEIGTSYYYAASPTHTFLAPGDYRLYAEFHTIDGCVSRVNETVHVPQALSPDFSVMKNCVGQEAVFTDITTGVDQVVARLWSFTGGQSTTNNPAVHTFTQQGAQTVVLKVTTQSGCAYEKSRDVQIISPPQAAFTAAPVTGAYPLEVSFVNASSNATSFLWEFMDRSGQTSEAESPVHTFSDPGSFDVRLTVYNPQLCESSISRTVTTLAPVPDANVESINLIHNADGSSRLVITISNKGNTILRALPLMIDLSGKLSLRQTLVDPILPGTKYNFVSEKAILDAESLRYICVSAEIDGDANPEGNRMCTDLQDGFFALPAYPNPASDALTIEWISVGAKKVLVALTDGLGRKVYSREVFSAEGLNHQAMDLATLCNGIYFLSIDDGSVRRIQRILVQNAP